MGVRLVCNVQSNRVDSLAHSLAVAAAATMIMM
jgi:hypothetical protein